MTIETYTAAREAFEKAAKRVNDLGEMIRKVGVAIETHPTSFRFSEANASLPAEVLAIPQDVNVSVHEWPLAGHIIELLSAYHDARIRTREAWNALPENLRSRTPPPPAGVL